MDQKWMKILMTVVVFQKITLGACEEKVIEENTEVEITCAVKDPGSTVVWFRILDTLKMEFIATFGLNGALREPRPPFRLSDNKKSIRLAFKKARDSGAYSCASQRNQEMKFGPVTRLVGKKVEVRTEAPPKTTKPLPCTTSAPCVCKSETEKDETSPSLHCSLLILGPLVGGCGLLLLLLIVTTLYCNKIRTRRCPHHHKRKPRPVPSGKPVMTNRHM
ncbi:T-cell surface glycoprotein CD8 alpha chain [Halichoeres trimaculatus]|uniref:T-cell surface glycoprotein CD8 alpha chain n=1 Tax=Halichoeres trimaculatus TaxID=147232 RepID=UPI003D9F3968